MQEGDDDMLDDENSTPSSGSGASKASGPGQGKAQFVSANPSTRPVTKRQAASEELL